MASKKFKLSKKTTKYLIYVVLASFLLGGLFVDYGRTRPNQDDAPQRQYNILIYESENVYPNPVECKIIAASSDVKIIVPPTARLTDDILEEIFDSEIPGVKSKVLEVSPNYAMFNLRVDEEASLDAILARVRISGAKAYNTYICDIQGRQIELIGRELEAGMTVNALIVDRMRAGFTETIGFAQEIISRPHKEEANQE
jgi:hypothetical protein